MLGGYFCIPKPEGTRTSRKGWQWRDGGGGAFFTGSFFLSCIRPGGWQGTELPGAVFPQVWGVATGTPGHPSSLAFFQHLPPGDTSPFPGGTAQSHVQDLPQWWSLLTSQGSPHPCHCGWRNPLGWWGLCFPGSHVATSSLSLGPQPPGNPPLDGLKLSAAVSDRTARMYLWFQRP